MYILPGTFKITMIFFITPPPHQNIRLEPLFFMCPLLFMLKNFQLLLLGSLTIVPHRNEQKIEGLLQAIYVSSLAYCCNLDLVTKYLLK